MNSAMPEAAAEPSSKSVQITLPDGSARTLEQGATGTDLATAIGPGLAKVVVAMVVDGEIWDLYRELPDGASVKFIRRQDDDALPLIRHDAAHAMAEAVQELYPGTQVTIGPSIEDGFYYDFARNEPFTPEDLEKIEARMAEIVDRAEPIAREVWNRDDAIALFEKMGEQYKVEIIQDLPEDETITLYRQGQFRRSLPRPAYAVDQRLGQGVQADEGRRRLLAGRRQQRPAAAHLRHRLGRQEAAECLSPSPRRGGAPRPQKTRQAARPVSSAGRSRRRRLLASPRLGALSRGRELHAPSARRIAGYLEVKTPEMYDRVFWEQSGHWEKFRENMFTLEVEHKTLAVKPMNCPAHVQIFNQTLQSLP